ncbi:MAG TPA: (deoxy)nucleoside triphosphate pyrophosphohydrolase [Peptococcaceae bacterium]|nr:(deoxy)nucleoside triphosphate pyrophosphohydrolase [Peptococcaceae bacterium]
MGKISSAYVTAAIIRQGDRILICRRAEGGSCSGLWEFPGGKLEQGESLEECLLRECREELGLHLKIKDVFARTSYNYGDKDLEFIFFSAEIIGGELKMKVHQEIEWVKPEELRFYAFCPADVEVARRLSEIQGDNCTGKG